MNDFRKLLDSYLNMEGKSSIFLDGELVYFEDFYQLYKAKELLVNKILQDADAKTFYLLLEGWVYHEVSVKSQEEIYAEQEVIEIS